MYIIWPTPHLILIYRRVLMSPESPDGSRTLPEGRQGLRQLLSVLSGSQISDYYVDTF